MNSLAFAMVLDQCNELRSAILKKGYKIRNYSNIFMVQGDGEAMFNATYYAEGLSDRYISRSFTKDQEEDALKDVMAQVATLPTVEEAKKLKFLQDLADVTERASELDLGAQALAGIEMLKATAKKLSENILAAPKKPYISGGEYVSNGDNLTFAKTHL